MQDPHYSRRGDSAVVKSNMRCGTSQDVAYNIRLWLCPRRPEGPKQSWPDQGCTVKAQHGGQEDVPPSGIIRQAPEPGGAQAHGTGWWVGSNSYIESPPGVIRVSTGRAVHLAG